MSDLRRLPSVDQLVKQPALQTLAQEYSPHAVVEGARLAINEARRAIQNGENAPESATLVEAAAQAIRRLWQPSLVPVINASGVIIHTNLGRAPLSSEALLAVATVAQGYSNLEYDLAAGERGSRHDHAGALLANLVGAPAGMVVNNNAAAMLLVLSALAKGKEVIVSRGQAVEIGGGFRIPDVMRQSGARLVEVGTTNRTYVRDYEDAITERTAALLQVHSSNFKVVGFTEGVALADLCTLGRRRGAPVINDLGSGSLLDTAPYGLAHEPLVQESVAAGAALTCFSGDKLMGGPQAGIVVGNGELIARLKRHPLARALRVDKMTLAALQVTTLHYLRGQAVQKVPVWMMIARPPAEIEAAAQAWAGRVAAWPGIATAEVRAGESTVGGGSLPGEALPTHVLALHVRGTSARGEEPTVQRLARRLRTGTPPVIARIERNALLLDPRTVLPGQEETLLQRLHDALD